MSGGNVWYQIYHDPKRDVYIKVEFYHKARLCEDSKLLLDTLSLLEERLIEYSSTLAERRGNNHCVRTSYPTTITLEQYKALLINKPVKPRRYRMWIPDPDASLILAKEDIPEMRKRYYNMDEVLASPNVRVM